uniref:Uncharacterized protein n=1 Tax=Ganoderma boninense TaxID=34458 RepID=A0A5K1K659_9APHY|nr:Uncharacterized protein [Ganoderma boninense]
MVSTEQPAIANMYYVVAHEALSASRVRIAYEWPQACPRTQHVPTADLDVREEVPPHLLKDPSAPILMCTSVRGHISGRVCRACDRVALPWEEEDVAAVGKVYLSRHLGKESTKVMFNTNFPIRCRERIELGYNLLLYSKQAQGEGRLPIPVGDRHKFALIALGAIAQLAAFVVTSEGPHGLADNVRSQVLVATGPQLTTGRELAQATSQALGTKMEFESIDNDTAKEILNSDQGAEVDVAEREYLLEYYSLVREDKTNYTATTAMLSYLGTHGQEPAEFFKTYSDEFKPKKRKVAGKPASAGASGKKVPSRGKAAAKSAGGDEEASSTSAPPEGWPETAPKDL